MSVRIPSATTWQFRAQKHTLQGLCGFSLIEVMVVVLVIAILGTVLFVVASRTRESAMGMMNANNHRQIIVALLLYSTANNGRLPYSEDNRNLSSDSDTQNGVYTRLLVKYGFIEDPSVFFSPKAGNWYLKYASNLAKPESPGAVPWYYTNYGGNRYGAMPRAHLDGVRQQLYTYRVEDPSMMIVIRDVYNSNGRGWIAADENNRGGGEAWFSGAMYYPPPELRYNGQVYASFLDGHVEAFDGDELLDLINRSSPEAYPLYHNIYVRP